VQRAQPGARALAAEQAAAQRDGYTAALTRQENERLLATGRIVPARITIALDLNELEGPEVDTACGAAEPDVDMWEMGLAVPTPQQVAKLAELTGFPAAYFYRPIKPGPLAGSAIFICYSGRRGCEARDPDVVDENGVLLYGGKPRELPAPVQGKLFLQVTVLVRGRPGPVPGRVHSLSRPGRPLCALLPAGTAERCGLVAGDPEHPLSAMAVAAALGHEIAGVLDPRRVLGHLIPAPGQVVALDALVAPVGVLDVDVLHASSPGWPITEGGLRWRWHAGGHYSCQPYINRSTVRPPLPGARAAAGRAGLQGSRVTGRARPRVIAERHVPVRQGRIPAA
jgi:hypothetical protein